MPFCAPKSSPVQTPSTPSSTSFLPTPMLNASTLSSRTSMYASPALMSTMNFSMPVMCQAISNIVSSRSPTMKYVVPKLGDVPDGVVEAASGSRIRPREGSHLVRGGGAAERHPDHVVVEDARLHHHPEFVDDAAIGRLRVVVARGQPSADHDTIAAHRGTQVVGRDAVGHIFVDRAVIHDGHAVLYAGFFEQRPAQIELERHPVRKTRTGQGPLHALFGIHKASGGGVRAQKLAALRARSTAGRPGSDAGRRAGRAPGRAGRRKDEPSRRTVRGARQPALRLRRRTRR